MGFFKKKQSKSNDDLIPHKIEITGMWSEKEKKFVKYDKLHVEGSRSALSELISKAIATDDSLKKIILKGMAIAAFGKTGGADIISKIENIENLKNETYTPSEHKDDSKSVKNMTDEEIAEMLRKNREDLE